MVSVKGIHKAFANPCVALKPTEEGISGVSGCGEGYLGIVAVCFVNLCDASCLLVVNVTCNGIGISRVVNLEHKVAVTVNVSAQYALRGIEGEVSKDLLLSGCSGVGFSRKVFYDRLFVAVFVYVFKVILDLVGCISVCVPNCVCGCIGGYGSAEVIIPGNEGVAGLGCGFGRFCKEALFHVLGGNVRSAV